MNMKWIVLSDLHMNFKNFNTRTAQSKLLERLKEEKQKGKISFVLINGDCFNRNKGHIEDIMNYIKQIAEACDVDINNVILCPGNHDINRDNRARKKAIAAYRNGGSLPSLDLCLEGYTNFGRLYGMLYRKDYQPFSKMVIENFRIYVIDSCLLSVDNQDYGNLVVNFPQLTDLGEKEEKDEKINIVVMHHGVEWLRPTEGRYFQHWLSDNHVQMVFCGHNHAPGVNILTEAIEDHGVARDGILQFTCGCALSDDYSNPVFLVGEYMENKSVKVEIYQYQPNSNWEIANAILRSFPNGIYQESSRNGLIKNSYDIPKIYSTIYDIGDDVTLELETSHRLDFFGLRGRTFQKDNSKIASALYKRKEDISCRLLVSDPYSKNIDKRLRNVPDFAQQSELEQQWRVIYEDIKRLKDNFPAIPTWNIRFHEQPLLFRFILTDESVYFGFYDKEKSSESCMYRYSKQASLYSSLQNFFDITWGSSDTHFSSVVPDRCSFVLPSFDIKPSLVINLAADCNMHCRYCPDGGENLKSCKLCNTKEIKFLLTAYADYYKQKHWTEKKVVRVTGGEPLLHQERLIEILSHAKSESFEKIILCTNGINFKECYENHSEIWDSIKNVLLLKISLDSMKEEIFNQLTGTNTLGTVISNIEFAASKGFRVELNLVATKENVQEIEPIYDYAHRRKLVGLKVLTINDFGGRIKQDDVESELNELIERMREHSYVETGLYVHNNKGIHMKRFIHDGCRLTIVDHQNTENSVTPRRTYSTACTSCKYYPESYYVTHENYNPCATGIMSLTMRADGLLSFCRMCDESDTWLSGKDLESVKKMVSTQLKNFENCFHCEIGEKK